MSSETMLLEEIDEKAPAASSRKAPKPAAEDAVHLTEDTSLPRPLRLPWGAARSSPAFFEGESDEVGGAVQIVFDESPVAGASRNPLRASLGALSDLRSQHTADGVDWFEAAAVLKRDVASLGDTNYSRHAAVLLALADALTFTEPAEVLLGDAWKPLLSHALGLLSEPYISEASEEEFLAELLVGGWNLTPSEEQALEPVD